jgi:hypothetical protein
MSLRTIIMLSIGAGLLIAIFTGEIAMLFFVFPFAVFALSAIELIRLLLGGHVSPD